ncbi:MAG: hypothetical protein J4F36_09645 [Nitrosopumilaceae archaeon]|nr:hypothetical protein [Nitrosopumilaceae archaeon]
MKTRLLTIIGIVMIIIGFTAMLTRSTYFLPPAEPPIMKPLEGIEYLIAVYPQAFLFIGIVGIFVTVAGFIIRMKQYRGGMKDMRT